MEVLRLLPLANSRKSAKNLRLAARFSVEESIMNTSIAFYSVACLFSSTDFRAKWAEFKSAPYSSESHHHSREMWFHEHLIGSQSVITELFPPPIFSDVVIATFSISPARSSFLA